MFDALSKVQVKDMSPEVKEVLQKLGQMDVLVGVPEEKSSRPEGAIGGNYANSKITNSELIYIHTHGIRQRSMIAEMQPNVNALGYNAAFQMYLQAHGSPLWQSPPRPIIEPAIEKKENKRILGEELGKAAQKALEGDAQSAQAQLEITGMTAQNIVRGWWDDPENNWPANTEETIENKGSSKPLVDTGELRKSITYIVRDNKND